MVFCRQSSNKFWSLKSLFSFDCGSVYACHLESMTSACCLFLLFSAILQFRLKSPPSPPFYHTLLPTGGMGGGEGGRALAIFGPTVGRAL